MFYFFTAITLLTATMGVSQVYSPAARGLERNTQIQVNNKVQSILERNCANYCNIINIDIEVQAKVPSGDDMGFEGRVGDGLPRELEVRRIILEVQIDSRITEENKRRLERILLLNMKNYSLSSEVIWSQVMSPRIGSHDGSLDSLKQVLDRSLRTQINQVVSHYCPNQCILENIQIEGQILTVDQSKLLPDRRIVKSEVDEVNMRVDQVNVELTIDEALPELERQKISKILGAKTRFVSPIEFGYNIIPFPEPYSKVQARQKLEEADPFGLEKLRRTLVMFKELAGTKEIITNSSSETSESSTSRRFASESTSMEQLSLEEIVTYIAGLILLLTLMAIALIKFVQAKKGAAEMILSSPLGNDGALRPEGEGARSFFSGKSEKDNGGSLTDEMIRLNIKVKELKEELLSLFMEQPKVAKDTFSRMMREDGIEETAKYVYVFGHIIIFELLNDPTLQRDLYELSEFYHSTEFKFELQEEYDLLTHLKTRVTASEIRVLTQKSSEKFEFLTRLDSSQIFNLIKQEKVQVQSIVLTQLDRKKRTAVFEMYRGSAKVDLLAELSTADAIPKEYMINVAAALQKKVSGSPEYDTENIRSSDILLDLMERSSLQEQKNLMKTLQVNNQETARSLKMKLVTIEILPFLKDGHMLEVMLGMERESLLTFLASCPNHIRDLLIRKAPEELADSWIEELEIYGAVDEANSRLAIMKVTSRIRNLANSGAISLLEINDKIFSEENDFDSAQGDGVTPIKAPFVPA